MAGAELPIVCFSTQREWEDWLEEHHAASPGLWLKIAKKGSGEVSVSYAEALDSAMCFGWIDGQKGRFDERFWLQRFSRRTPRSHWSVRNRLRVQELMAEGRVRPAGRSEVERAKEDGRWERAYESQANASVPEDLRRALEGNRSALELFENLDRTNRYAILYRVQDAVRPETRARRIQKFVAMLGEGNVIYPQLQSGGKRADAKRTDGQGAGGKSPESS